MTGTTPQTLPAGPASSRAWLYGSGTVQYLFMRNPGGDPRNFQPSAHAEQVRRISALMDSTDPDLSAFARRGGKLVLSEHMADYAQSPYAGIEYWKNVVDKLGRNSTDDFMRLYVTPGADHVGTGAPTMVDMIDVLMAWVERGQAPGDLVQVSLQDAPPHAETLSRPMCRLSDLPALRGQWRRRYEECRLVQMRGAWRKLTPHPPVSSSKRASERRGRESHRTQAPANCCPPGAGRLQPPRSARTDRGSIRAESG